MQRAFEQLEELDAESAFAVRLVIEERLSQLKHNGYSCKQDDRINDKGQLIRAAAAYLLASIHDAIGAMNVWPWPTNTYKPRQPFPNLVRAGAMIIAELSRRQRTKFAKLELTQYGPGR